MRILPEPCAALCSADLLRLDADFLAGRLSGHIEIALNRQNPPSPERLARSIARDILSASPADFLFAGPDNCLRIFPGASGALGAAFHKAFESSNCCVEGSKIQFVLSHPAIYASALENCPALCAKLDEHAGAGQPPPSKAAIERARTQEHLEALREQNLSEAETKALNLFMLEGAFSASPNPTRKFSEACGAILGIALREDASGNHARCWLRGISMQTWGAPCVRDFLRTAMATFEARDLAEDIRLNTDPPQPAPKKQTL